MTGPQLKQAGMARAAGRHDKSLEAAQAIARGLGRKFASVTIEDVRYSFDTIYTEPWDLGNAAGSVFAGPGWECVGYTPAKRPEAHARILRVWRLK